jgi:hypothetical protein
MCEKDAAGQGLRASETEKHGAMNRSKDELKNKTPQVFNPVNYNKNAQQASELSRLPAPQSEDGNACFTANPPRQCWLIGRQ